MKKKLLFSLTAFGFVSIASSQTVISGSVRDSTGQSLPFANVFIKGTSTGVTTDTAGNYQFTSLDTGMVIITAMAVGYIPLEQKAVLRGERIVIQFNLKSKGRELSTVVISAGSFEAGDEKKSVVLRSRDISTTAGANGDISTVMNTLPGTQKIGEEEGLFVRGGSGQETKTVIDELIVQTPFFSSVPSVPQKGRFSSFLFKGTLFSTGGYSALYGQALSSVLILNTDDLPDNNSTSIGVLPFGGNLSHTQRNNKSSLSLEGNYANMRPYFSAMPQMTDWDKEPESVSGSVFYKRKTSEYGMFKLYGYASSSSLSLYSIDINDPSNRNKFSNSNNNYYAFANYKGVLGEKWRYFIAGSYTYDKDKRLINTTDISSLKQFGQGKILLKRQIFKNGSDLKFGAEMQSNVIRSTFDTTVTGTAELYHAVFTEGEFYISKRFGIRTGLRYEYSDLIPVARFSPRISMAYKLTESSSLSMAYGDFYQNPESRYLVLNPGLKNEHARHYILSYQLEVKKRLFRVEAYNKEYDQLIKYNPDSIQTTLSNNGHGYARGIDVFWRDNKVTFKNMDYWISYSYVLTKRNYLNFPVLATPSFAPVHNLSVVYKYNFKKIKSHAGFTYLYSSGRPYYNPNLPTDQYNSQLTREYHNLSLSLSKYGFIKERHFFVIYFSINNVLNRKNVFGYRYSTDGNNRMEVQPAALRTFFLGVFISFNGLEKKKYPKE
jgi:outer membrane cobalamin receptor